jgi:hypothetical protein
MEKLPDMATPYRVSTQPPENPCPTCSIVPDRPLAVVALPLTPNLLPNDKTDGKTYGIVVAIDPDWLKQEGTTRLDSAILVVDCQTGLKTKERFDVTSMVLPLSQPVPPPVRLSFDKIDGRKSLAGCTASVDFKLTVVTPSGTEERSVQSPVYVDP